MTLARPLALQPRLRTKNSAVIDHATRSTNRRTHFGSNPRAMRDYMEYLIRTNGLNPTEVRHRTISLHYWTVLSREEAAAAGKHYGPEADRVLDSY